MSTGDENIKEIEGLRAKKDKKPKKNKKSAQPKGRTLNKILYNERSALESFLMSSPRSSLIIHILALACDFVKGFFAVFEIFL